MIDEEKILQKLKIKIAVSNFGKEILQSSNDKSTPKWRFDKVKKLIATIITIIMLTFGSVFAYEIVSQKLNEIDVSFDAKYEGEGKVAILIENRSDKTLEFQNRIKLMHWFGDEEVKKISNYARFENTSINPGSSAVMTIDISKMYDLEKLEKPLEDGDYYYLVLTNNNFILGYDWHCTIEFTEDSQNEIDRTLEYVPQIQLDEEESHSSNFEIIEELKPFFEDYAINPTLRNEKIEKYYMEAGKIISKEKANGKNIISTVNPYLFIKDPDKNVIFDSRILADLQYQLIGEHHYTTSLYNIPVGATRFEDCLVLSTYIPQSKRDIQKTGGAELPLVYIFQYELSEVNKPNTFAFIYGRLLSFDELEGYKVYQDEKYVCYDCTDLFYNDLDKYIDTYASSRYDIYIDDAVKTRIQNVYSYLRNKENLSKSFYYHK